ncbi:hypothetical protein MKZ38_002731 [Zalerion maritima]|uniref:Uncharacterized protein n=1 Tax=Zalerion maritima TaxID=339359 RepID=A0AAD5RPD6_9PEZI|nr:hypothetical protein MKZ38_002731 [Zalerion maritima]
MSSHGSRHGSAQGRSSSRGPGGSSHSRQGSRSSRHGSQYGSQPGTPRPAQAAAAMGQPPFGADPARDPQRLKHEAESEFKKRYANIDLPPEAYAKTALDTPFARRPALNSSGKAVKIEVNQFAVASMGSGAEVHQYDLTLFPEPSKLTFFNMIWKTDTVQKKLHEGNMKRTWIHDGRRLAWSMNKLPGQMEIVVDMDKEKGQRARPGRSNTFTLYIRPATTIRMNILEGYLTGKVAWDASLLECMNLLDHLLRMGPAQRGLLKIRRNFYDPNASTFKFDDMVVGKKGIYAAFTMNGAFGQVPGGRRLMGLAINVDVANTTFWDSTRLLYMMRHVAVAKGPKFLRDKPLEQFHGYWRPVKVMKNGEPHLEPSEHFRQLRILHRVEFSLSHRNNERHKVYKISKFEFDTAYGEVGATANQVTFNYNGKVISIREYFLEKYNTTLDYPNWPVVVTSKQGIFPVEVCHIAPDQRYTFKLTPDQTSKMITFAVTKPPARRNDIMRNVSLLNWGNDRFLKDFGICINSSMTMTEAKLLQNPKIQFGGAIHDPGTSGRWDLRSKKFLTPNSLELSNWAVVSVANIGKDHLTKFYAMFKSIYRGHGGRIKQDPLVKAYNPRLRVEDIIPQIMSDVKTAYGGAYPQLIMIAVPDQLQERYERIKQEFDCTFAVLTQVLLSKNVVACKGQYISNVCMKVNAKLGGATTRVFSQSGTFKVPTLMMGIDVSHPSPGSLYGSSIAAMAMSVDRDATRYVAQCQTNGTRVELLSPNVIREHLYPMIGNWVKAMGGTVPMHIYYLRDGVAHSQFSQLIDTEIKELKSLLEPYCNPMPKFTVVVAQKRHHIRFFPRQNDKVAGDRNGNALPGTLVEKDVTHPFHYDFYLSSHSAIQGTARPTHYHVILDEAGVSVNELHRLLYQQCYQYVRSTTPVSIHPAIYYAHLAGKRGVMHEDINLAKKHKSSEEKFYDEMVKTLKKDEDYYVRKATELTTPSLRPIGSASTPEYAKTFFKGSMWFV